MPAVQSLAQMSSAALEPLLCAVQCVAEAFCTPAEGLHIPAPALQLYWRKHQGISIWIVTNMRLGHNGPLGIRLHSSTKQALMLIRFAMIHSDPCFST